MTLSHLNEDHENDLNCHLTTVTLVSSVLLVHLSVKSVTWPQLSDSGVLMEKLTEK